MHGYSGYSSPLIRAAARRAKNGPVDSSATFSVYDF
jgi:hypothetical protein